MPWVEALLRGQKVLAKVREDGSFLEEDGRVEIRYRPTDTKAYRALARNLGRVSGGKVLPDDACVPAEFAPPKEPAGGNAASAGGTASAPKSAASKNAASKNAASKNAAVANGSGNGAAGADALKPTDWIAYTDGACSGNPGPAGLGVVLIAPGGAQGEGFEYLGTATNNIAELTAILRALEAAPADAPRVVVHTDSQYAIGVLAKGWRAKANTELVESIRGAIAARGRGRVKLVYVPGHSGVPLNERADELAREAIRARRSQALRSPV